MRRLLVGASRSTRVGIRRRCVPSGLGASSTVWFSAFHGVTCTRVSTCELGKRSPPNGAGRRPTSLISLLFLRNLSMCECARRCRHSLVILMRSRRAKGAATTVTVPSKLYISELDDDNFESSRVFLVLLYESVVNCHFCCMAPPPLLHLSKQPRCRHRDDIFEFLINIHTELKKDPRCTATQAFCTFALSFGTCLCSRLARLRAHSLSQSLPQSPPNKDAVMASEPTLSSLAPARGVHIYL